MTHKIDELVRMKQELDKSVVETLKYLTDTSFTLEQRWDWFTLLSKSNLLKTKPYGSGLVTLLDQNYTPYDNFYIERHQTSSYLDILETFEDNQEDDSRDDRVVVWKEAVLADGYGSFKYDW